MYFLQEYTSEIDNYLNKKDPEHKLCWSKVYNSYYKPIDKEIKATTIDIQTKLLKKVIIPHFDKNHKITDENFDKAIECLELINDYTTLAGTEMDLLDAIAQTPEYKNLKEITDKIITQYIQDNINKVNNLEKEKVKKLGKKMVRYSRVEKKPGIYEVIYEFLNRLDERFITIKKEEDTNILNEIKNNMKQNKKIDINLISNNYETPYTSWNINEKVLETILGRKFTVQQTNDLMQEIQVYKDCKKVISKRDIKKEKNANGDFEYYVEIEGQRYKNEHLRKMKLNKKFLSSRKFEVVQHNNEFTSQEVKSEKEESLSVIEHIEGKNGSIITRFINFLKNKFNKKNTQIPSDTQNIRKENFRKSLELHIEDKETLTKQNIEEKEVKEIEESER